LLPAAHCLLPAGPFRHGTVLRGRFAPSPTGDLHLGGAYTALAAWLRVRAAGGKLVVRMEDLDPPRVVPGAADRILDDMEWLGLDWDEGPRVGGPFGPYVQSERLDRYNDVLDRLANVGVAYPCTCSRSEVARIASAPHLGEDGPVYPGLCRNPANRKPGRPAALRLAVPAGGSSVVEFEDGCHGRLKEDVSRTVGDFVLRRADGLVAYQLAVVVDDLDMQITEVVRGDDLLSSTGRQILLARMLGGTPPAYVHLPVVLGPDGERLAKRHQARWKGTTISQLRSSGVLSTEILGRLAHALGLLLAPKPVSTSELISRTRSSTLHPAGSWQVPDEWLSVE